MGNCLLSILCCKYFKKSKNDLTNSITIKKRSDEFEETLLRPLESEEIQLQIKNIEELKINTNQCVLKRQGDPKKYYEWDEIEDEIGRGAYGVVYRVKSILLQQERAMKQICKSDLNNSKSLEFVNEIRILQNLDHPNIIKIYELIEDENFFYIVTEFIPHGNFLQKILNFEHKNEIIVGLMMFQILSAVSYLHKNNIIHGDLKPENIMLSGLQYYNETNGNKGNNNTVNNCKRNTFNTSMKIDLKDVEEFIKEKSSKNKYSNNLQNQNQNQFTQKEEIQEYLLNAKNFQFKNLANYQLKLIDFGCSKVLSNRHYKYMDIIGTTSYMAPEVALNKYNEKCDIWSCGVIMFVLLFNIFPFGGETVEEIEENILNYKFSIADDKINSISDSALDLLKLLLTYNPNERISAKEALNHPFFSKNFNTNNIFNENINCSEILNNMKNYKNDLVAQKFIDCYLSYNFINPEEVDKIRKVFKLLDSNNNGMLTKNDLISGFKKSKINMNQEELDNFLKKIDGNNNGMIEFEEFIRICSDKKRLYSEENLKIAFETLDHDNDGFITKEEMKKIFFEKCDLSDDILDEFIKQFNSNDGERICVEDFLKVMKNTK